MRANQKRLPLKSRVRIKNVIKSTLADAKTAEKSEKPKKEKHVVRRGRTLERPERRYHNHKETKEKVEGWRKGLE
jgi:hypothetical protein